MATKKSTATRDKNIPSGRSIADWEKELGKGEDGALDKHQAAIKGMVDVMIANHDDLEKCRRAHLSWDLIEAKTLEKLEEMQVKIKHPGFKHYGEQAYKDEFLLFDEEKERLGHKPFELAGIAGYLVPNADVREVEFNDISSSRVKSTVDLSQGVDCGLNVEQNMKNFAQQARQNLGNLPCTPLKTSLNAAASSRVITPSTPSAVATPSPKAQAASPVGAALPSKASGTPRAKSTADAAEAKPAGSKPAGSKPAGPKSETRGRKPRDVQTEGVALLEEFAKAHPNDPLFFGEEKATGVAKLQDLLKAIAARCKKSAIDIELDALEKLTKQCKAALAVLQAVGEHGLRNPEFAKVFDTQISWINIEPVVPGSCFYGPRRLSKVPETRTSHIGLVSCGSFASAARPEHPYSISIGYAGISPHVYT